MNTEKMLESLENAGHFNDAQAKELAKNALKEYGHFSREAGQVKSALDSGCPETIYTAVYNLYAKHKKQTA